MPSWRRRPRGSAVASGVWPTLLASLAPQIGGALPHFPNMEAHVLSAEGSHDAGLPAVSADELAAEAEEMITPGDAVRFGPGGCVATWRSSSSHCLLRTDCAAEAASLAAYPIRLVCVQDDGSRTSHAFGEGAFDARETFDTMIQCSDCTADDAQAVSLSMRSVSAAASANATQHQERVQLNSTVQALTMKVALLKQNILAAQAQVRMMRGMVYTTPAPGAAQAPSPERAGDPDNVKFAFPRIDEGTDQRIVLHAPQIPGALRHVDPKAPTAVAHRFGRHLRGPPTPGAAADPAKRRPAPQSRPMTAPAASRTRPSTPVAAAAAAAAPPIAARR
mmetsp:Transcript_49341/g.141865  ORF Transcript_49341/g.141865 Transcript_49341/m.141865 type:complete len:334 (-) Transcript_49341:220-1221(-)